MTTDATPPDDVPSSEQPRSPTRRRLLAMLAAFPAASQSAEPTRASIADRPYDPIPGLFIQFQAILAAHERALAHVDRREAELVAHLGYPRVRLPTPPNAPPLYAADASTIDRQLPASSQARRLKRRLRHRKQTWNAAATAGGLTDARTYEAAVARAVHTIGAALLAQPAITLDGVRLKLLVLLALHQPGEADRDAAPWGDLHRILGDLTAQLASPPISSLSLPGLPSAP